MKTNNSVGANKSVVRKNLIIVVTGFTIGHSITLALGALNYVTPASSFVESLIGYSIVVVAIECVASITKQYTLYNRYILYSWILFILLFDKLAYILSRAVQFAHNSFTFNCSYYSIFLL